MRPDARGPAGRHLLPLLGDIRHVLRMSLADWDETLRLARQARLLGVIAHRIEREPELLAAVPPVGEASPEPPETLGQPADA